VSFIKSEKLSKQIKLFHFRSILDSYIQAPDEVVPEPEVKSPAEDEEEVISLDSDDEGDNIPLKSQDITLWYSAFLKSLERRYPTAFDQVVKDVMSRMPGRKRNGLKNVLGEFFVCRFLNSRFNFFLFISKVSS
jgi:hypothetical protein